MNVLVGIRKWPLVIGRKTHRRRFYGFLLAVLSSFVVACNPSIEKGREFTRTIKSHLNTEGDWIEVAETYPGDWTQVCVFESMSTGGYVDSALLKKWFEISAETRLELPYGIASTSDRNWGIVFFTPPSTFDSLHIDNKAIHGGAFRKVDDANYPICQPRDRAVFYYHRNALDRSVEYLTLMDKKSIRVFSENIQEESN